MVQQIEVMVGFVAKPKVIRDGQAAMCILRPPSAKELSQKEKKKAAASQPDSQSETVDHTDKTQLATEQWFETEVEFEYWVLV